MPEPENTAPRPVTLAVEDPKLRALLGDLLAERGIDAEFVERREAVVGSDAETATLVVVPSDEVDPDGPLLEASLTDDGPGVVVLGDERPVDEARLVAAGASALLDSDDSTARLANEIADLAEAEVDGGLHGPESSGAVAEPKLADFHSRSPSMREFVDLVRRIADTDSTLLITGETGVGKERLARAIHAESTRFEQPFVSINCGALPENLLESELFGHEKGAFTGADAQRRGRFEEADGGALFLDEIGEMPMHLQVKLLTVLQRREVRRLGAETARTVDVRILSATNRRLEDEVAEGRFREDLFYRLNVVTLDIPPLRDRNEDVPWLVGRFLRHFVEEHGRTTLPEIDAEAMGLLQHYAWPGNVRELVNVMERAVLLCRGDRLGVSDLPEQVRGGGAARTGTSQAAATNAAPGLHLDQPLTEARRRVVEEFERRYLEGVLRATGGAVGETATRAGINPRTLYEKMRRYGLRKEDFA